MKQDKGWSLSLNRSNVSLPRAGGIKVFQLLNFRNRDFKSVSPTRTETGRTGRTSELLLKMNASVLSSFSFSFSLVIHNPKCHSEFCGWRCGWAEEQMINYHLQQNNVVKENEFVRLIKWWHLLQCNLFSVSQTAGFLYFILFNAPGHRPLLSFVIRLKD